MAEIQGVKQVLSQTPAVEKLQEGARRLGDQQQQGFATTLNRQVDDRERRVNEGEKARQEELDPNAGQKREENPRRRSATAPPGKTDESESNEEDRGQHVDTRA